MQLQRDWKVLQAAGYNLAAISYDDPAVLRDFAVRRSIAYPLLSDRGSETIRAFGVKDRRYHQSDQLDIDRETVYNGDAGFTPVYGLAYPSVFLVGTDGLVIWRDVSEAAEFRLTGAAILAHSVGTIVEAKPALVNASKFKVKLSSSNATVALGNRIFLNVDLELPPGLHVYGQPLKPTYRALEWVMDDSHHCWTAGPVSYPKPESRQFPFEAAPLPVYRGTVQLQRELTIPPAIDPQDDSIFRKFREVCLDAASRIPIAGVLKVQACSDRECFPPESLPLQWKLDFTPPDRERVPVRIRREHAGVE